MSTITGTIEITDELRSLATWLRRIVIAVTVATALLTFLSFAVGYVAWDYYKAKRAVQDAVATQVRELKEQREIERAITQPRGEPQYEVPRWATPPKKS